MTLEEFMGYKNYVVIGSTDNPEKYAYKIKERLIECGYKVYCVNKNNPINKIDMDVDIIDLCVNPTLGLSILKEYHDLKNIKGVLIQPGAESDEIKNFLQNNNIEYIEGCVLVGLSLYSK